MILNSKTVSIKEASKLLNKGQDEILRLAQYGYLEQSKLVDGKIRMYLKSIEQYALRYDITLNYDTPSTPHRSYDWLTIKEAMVKLGFTDEKKLHKLIQASRLKAIFIQGSYKVSEESIRNYLIGGNNL